jgi:hypothetical protein
MVRRGLRTALVTGGLLMLGTGIASATENVNPDLPASPIDGGVLIPVHIADNAVGTPVGRIDVPNVDRTVSTDDLHGMTPMVEPVEHGNQGRAGIVAPIDISGNAIAAGGDTTVVGDSHQHAGWTDPVDAGQPPNSLAGNVVAVNHALPVQVTGNALGLVGNAASTDSAVQSATTGGDITTSGTGSSLAGNIITEQGATPVQVDGNAIAGAGQASTQATTNSTATSAGSLFTDGGNGTGAGNVGAVPLAVPVEVTDHAISGIGNATSGGQNTVTATSGDADRSTTRGNTYLSTNGDPATLSGNAVTPAVANAVALTCNAVGAAGSSSSACATTDTTTAGGTTNTSGAGSTGSGNLVQAPIAEPTHAFGNGAAVLGNATAGSSIVDNAATLGNSYTTGDHSVLSSTNATAPVAGANDVFANGASGIGNASGTAVSDVRSVAGGYNGTTGGSSAGSGNIAQLPVAAPLEAYGVAGSAGGNAAGTVPAESKLIRAGGAPNTNDDNGTLSSNVVSAPTAVPAQIFGDAAGVAANTSSLANNGTSVVAGGNPSATGNSGTASGNVVALPTADPAQIFNDGASVVGNGTATGQNATTVGSGGDARTSGQGGTLAGDIVAVSDAGPIQAFGVAAASPGNEEADSLNNTHTTAGGSAVTSGMRGSLAGDVIGAQVSQVEQAFGTGIAGAGNSTANAVSDTATRSGGDTSSSGAWGSLSGDLVTVPATDLTKASADGVSALGNEKSFADDTTGAISGGTTHTTGTGTLDGVDLGAPAGAAVTVFRVPVEVLGRAIDWGHSVTSISDAGTAPLVAVPVAAAGAAEPQFGPSDSIDSLLRVDQVPSLAQLFVLPNLPRAVPVNDPFGATQRIAGLPLVSSVPGVPTPRRSGGSELQYEPMNGDLPIAGNLPAPPVTANLPSLSRPSLPSLPNLPTVSAPSLAAFPDLPPVPTLPAMPPLPGRPTTQALPVGPALPNLPTLPTPNLSAPTLSAPTLRAPNLPTAGLPATPMLPGVPQLPGTAHPQDLPAGSAQRLMAELRGLIERATGENLPPAL